MVNKVILIGNLGADPEVRTATTGTTVATLRIATTDRRKDREGNWSDHTEWHNVVLFGKTAENAQRFLKKGKQVFIEGRLQTRKWQDKEGRDRWTTEVIGDNMRFLGSREGGGGGSREVAPPPEPSYAENAGGGGATGGDDDIPF